MNYLNIEIQIMLVSEIIQPYVHTVVMRSCINTGVIFQFETYLLFNRTKYIFYATFL